MEDWRLNPDLLSLVLEKLPSLTDYLHFSVVCKSWHDAAQSEKCRQVFVETSHDQLPLLLTPTSEGSKKRYLYSIAKDKILDFQVSVPYGQRCCGSSHGWLLFNTETCFTMLNPFTGKTVKLPPVRFGVDAIIFEEGEVESFYSNHVTKAVLSCDPFLNPDDYEVVVIYGGMCTLAIFKAGDENWTAIEDHPEIDGFLDVIYHKSAFHAIDAWMGLWKISSITGKDNTLVRVRSYKLDMVTPRYIPQSGEDKQYFGYCRYTYVVESSKGDLVCVTRILDCKEGEEDDDESQAITVKFRVLKLVITDNHLKKWIKIDSLHDDDALFIGDNHSMAINNVNDIPGYKKNSIYYTDDRGVDMTYRFNGPRDTGIFNLQNQSLGIHYTADACPVPMPPAVWIVPSLVVLDGGETK